MSIKPMSVIVPKGDDLPRATVPFWAATARGWMVNIPVLYGEAQIRTPKPPTVLKDFKELFHFNGKKLPVHIIKQAHDFFRSIYTAHNTESSVYITHNHTTGRYRLFVPEQYVTHGSVNHKLEPSAIQKAYGSDWYAVGTIHSHCNFSAFHSGTDTHDMGQMPGIHITIGYVNRDKPEHAIALAVDKVKFDLKWEEIIDDSEEAQKDLNGYDTAPAWWQRFVHPNENAPWSTGGTSITYHKNKNQNHLKGKRHDPKRTRTQHWSAYDWDPEGFDADMYARSVREGSYMAQRHEQAQKQKDAFTEHEAEVEMTEAILQDVVKRMAMFGFAISYSIHYAPERAATYLAKLAQKEPEQQSLLLPGERA